MRLSTLSTLLILVTTSPAAFSSECNSRLSITPEVESEIADWIKVQMQAAKDPGVALAVSLADPRGQANTAMIKHFGIAEVRADGTTIAVSENTKFRIASNSKMFASQALFKILSSGQYKDQNGKKLDFNTKLINIDTPLFRHIRHLQRTNKLTGNDNWARVTLGDLVNHTSGMSLDFYGRDKWTDAETAKTGREMNEAEFMENLTKFTWAFSPQQHRYDFREKYSNAGYGFLGAVIGQLVAPPEQASDPNTQFNWVQNFQNYVTKVIFNPLGMDATYDVKKGEPYSKGFSSDRGSEPPTPDMLRYSGRNQQPDVLIPGVYAPSIGVATTADGIARYTNWMLSEIMGFDGSPNLVGKSAVRNSAKRIYAVSNNKARGFGPFWEYQKDDEGKTVLALGHTGMERGHMTIVFMFPEYGLGISVLGNSIDLDRKKYVMGIYNILKKHGLLKRSTDAWVTSVTKGIKAKIDGYDAKQFAPPTESNKHVLTEEAARQIVGTLESELLTNGKIEIVDGQLVLWENEKDDTSQILFQQIPNPATPCHPFAYVVVGGHFYQGDRLDFECSGDGKTVTVARLANGTYYKLIKAK